MGALKRGEPPLGMMGVWQGSEYTSASILSCFAIVVRGIHKMVNIYQTDYSIHSKQRIFRYSEVIHESSTFKLTKG